MSAACEVWFYHLERTGLDQALPELLQKTLARGEQHRLARRRWATLKGAGHPVSYWRQSDQGRWEKQA